MTPKPIPLSNEKCSCRCPYYMDGPVLSLCRFTNEQLVYGGTIPPKRTERCKQETSNRLHCCVGLGRGINEVFVKELVMVKTYTKDTLTREVLEKGVKLRVIDKEHSAAFQRACLDLGVLWGDWGENRVQLTAEPGLLVQAWKGKLSLRYIDSLGSFDSQPETEIYFDDGRASTSPDTQFNKAYIIDFSRKGCIETVIDDGRPAFQRLRELGVLFDSKQDAQRWLDNHIDLEKKNEEI